MNKAKRMKRVITVNKKKTYGTLVLEVALSAKHRKEIKPPGGLYILIPEGEQVTLPDGAHVIVNDEGRWELTEVDRTPRTEMLFYQPGLPFLVDAEGNVWKNTTADPSVPLKNWNVVLCGPKEIRQLMVEFFFESVRRIQSKKSKIAR